jgi:hypothetical protein
MVVAAGVPLVSGYFLAGSSFRQGVLVTTVHRPGGSDSVGSVLALSAHATGVIGVLAVLGAVLCMFRMRSGPERALAWVLAGAGLLAPAEQARIHTLTSLFKHVDYGAWFACIVVGYLLGEWSPGPARARTRGTRAASTGAGERGGDRGWALALSAAVALVAGISSAKTTGAEYAGWPNSRPIITALSRVLRPADYYLIEDPSLVTYYLRSEIPFVHVDSTFGFSYADPGTGRALVDGPAYALAIKQGYFAAVVLRFGATAGRDHQLVRDMRADNDYRLAEVVPYRTSYGPGAYQIWVRAPSRTG